MSAAITLAERIADTVFALRRDQVEWDGNLGQATFRVSKDGRTFEVVVKEVETMGSEVG